jgi:hypothetical protein
MLQWMGRGGSDMRNFTFYCMHFSIVYLTIDKYTLLILKSKKESKNRENKETLFLL